MSTVSRPGYWGGWGSRFMNDAALVLSQLLVVFSSLVIWFFSALTFFGEPLKRDDYVDMAVGFGLSAALLLLGLIPGRALRCSTWVTLMGVLLAALCLLACGFAVTEAAAAAPVPPDDGWLRTAAFFVLVPSSWPMFVLLALIPWIRRGGVRGSSSPGPRPLQAHGAGPGRPPST